MQPDDVRHQAFALPDKPSTVTASLMYDAIMALGLASCESGENFFSGEKLYEEFKLLEFKGASGLVRFDKATGTRDFASMNYTVNNIVANPSPRTDIVSFKSSVVAEASYVPNSARDGWSLVWSSTGKMPFVYADGGTVPPPCLPPIDVDLNLINKYVLAVGLTCSAIVLSVSIGLGLWIFVKRKCRTIRLSQPEFLIMLCFGTFILGLSIVPMGFQDPIRSELLNRACMASSWLFWLGFAIAFSALLAKKQRINKVRQKYLRSCLWHDNLD